MASPKSKGGKKGTKTKVFQKSALTGEIVTVSDKLAALNALNAASAKGNYTNWHSL